MKCNKLTEVHQEEVKEDWIKEVEDKGKTKEEVEEGKTKEEA